ncbi:MAG: hypothetical protein LBS57_08955 [Treponema sp.]|jgi:hypothetical protein|nr:hypothetical protein [Treponema sp.]
MKDTGIALFKIEGKPALGFDTGLDASAFARTKSARLISERGLIVFPGGKIETWQVGGIVEREAGSGESGRRGDCPAGRTMVVWGPPFAGERLDILINDDGRKDESIFALRRWIGALLSLDGGASLCPWGALVAVDSAGGDAAFPPGAVFFPPQTLMLRCAQAGGMETLIRGGAAFVHPDLSGFDAAAFSAAALLYRVFAGEPPFPAAEETLLHEDMREGAFIPPALAAPGLDEELAALVREALGFSKKAGDRKPDRAREILVRFAEILDGGGAEKAAANLSPAPFSSFFRPLDSEEQAKIGGERRLFVKRKKLTLKTRRFAARNAALIMGIGAAVLIAVFVGRSLAVSRDARPSTEGMTPLEVIQSYYGAFERLDHEMMEACAIRGAGKNDITMITNFYVISRIRLAYERNAAPFSVPRVTDIRIEKSAGSEESGELLCRVSYTLSLPLPSEEGQNAAQENAPAEEHAIYDELTLVRHKGAWRIAEITRNE